MKQTEKAHEIARAFFETLNGIALQQLSEAADKLQGVSGKPASLEKHIDAALPSDALPQVRNFLLSLATEDSLTDLPRIVEEYEAIISTGPGPTEAEVVSAIPLDDAQRERVVGELQQYGVHVEHLNFRVDESLIGGLVIRIGDKVFDNSLRARLGVVQRSMMMS